EDAEGGGKPREDQALVGVEEIPGAHGLEVGDHQHLPGDHHGGHHHKEDDLLCLKLDEHNGVCRQQGEEDLQDGGQHPHNGGVEHVVEQGLGLEGVYVVCEVQGIGDVVPLEDVV